MLATEKKHPCIFKPIILLLTINRPQHPHNKQEINLEHHPRPKSLHNNKMQGHSFIILRTILRKPSKIQLSLILSIFEFRVESVYLVPNCVQSRVGELV
jgi:hypothetical protein